MTWPYLQWKHVSKRPFSQQCHYLFGTIRWCCMFSAFIFSGFSPFCCQFCSSCWLLMRIMCQVCAWLDGVWVNIFEKQMWGCQKKRITLHVMVFCVRWQSLGALWLQGLYFMQYKHSQQTTRERTSQSVPGLKMKASPPPSQWWWSYTHTHTHTGLASFSFTHSLVLIALALFIHGDPGADTISFYLSYISQLPALFSQNCFSSTLHALAISVSYFVSFKLYLRLYQNRCPNKYKNIQIQIQNSLSVPEGQFVPPVNPSKINTGI